MCIATEEITMPNDRSQLYAVRALRDRLEAGALSRLVRCDARDMLCDALTKGAFRGVLHGGLDDFDRRHLLVHGRGDRFRGKPQGGPRF